MNLFASFTPWAHLLSKVPRAAWRVGRHGELCHGFDAEAPNGAHPRRSDEEFTVELDARLTWLRPEPIAMP